MRLNLDGRRVKSSSLVTPRVNLKLTSNLATFIIAYGKILTYLIALNSTASFERKAICGIRDK